MREKTCIEWFEKNLKAIASGNDDSEVANVAVVFTKKAKAGNYDLISDDIYQFLLDECEEVSSLWEKKPSKTHLELFQAAFKQMHMDKKSIKKIAKTIAECYCNQVKPFTENNELLDEDNIISELNQWEENSALEKEYIDTSSADQQTGNKQASRVDMCDNLIDTPKDIYQYLSERIYGQKEAVVAASMLLYNHLNGRKRNLLFAGPTGCGKTEIWRVLKQIYPYIKIVDSTTITMDGWSGGFKLRDIFAGMKRTEAEKSIIVFDEFDKFCEPIYGNNGTNYSSSGQNELLKLIEGSTIKYQADKERKPLEFDSSKISFVFCGSFEQMLQKKGEDEKSVGFGANLVHTEMNRQYTQTFMPKDLIKYASVRREIAGRINQIIQLYPMTEEDFTVILSDEHISPIYKLEKEYGVKISISGKTKKLLVSEAAHAKMGVRYLKSQIQSMLDEQMFFDCKKNEYKLGA